MNRPWFDPQTNLLLLDEYVTSMPSFQKAMADSIVTDDELEEQTQRTIHLLKKLEGMLSPEARETATDALSELAVLFALQQRHQSVRTAH
jgi:hypothetical protein